jgi:hypothetical protein
MCVLQNARYGIVLVVFLSFPAGAENTAFQTPALGRNRGVWRLTHDPTVRHHANYHNTQCWSPDGRFSCLHDLGRRWRQVDSQAHDVRLAPRWRRNAIHDGNRSGVVVHRITKGPASIRISSGEKSVQGNVT